MSMDRLGAAFLGLLRSFLGFNAAKSVDATARFWGKVVKVNGTQIDVLLDSTAIASPSGVTLYLGLPNCTVTGIEGARVLIGFRNGDPSQPFADDFEQSSPVGTITIGQSSPQPAARKGDPVSLGQCYVVMGAGPLATVIAQVFIDGVALPIAVDPGTATRGSIKDGSSTIKIGG